MTKKWKRANTYRITQQAGLIAQAAADIEAILRTHLPAPAYDEIEAAWETKPTVETIYPEQRRDYLITAARDQGLLMEIPLSVFGD